MHVLEAAREVPYLEPIMLTAYPSATTSAQALSQGVFRYIMKGEETAGPPGDDDVPKQFMRRLSRAVGLAVRNRDVMVTLSECLEQMQELVGNLERGQQSIASFLDDAATYLDVARKAYGRILKARGRHPDGLAD